MHVRRLGHTPTKVLRADRDVQCLCLTDQLERVFLRLGHAETDEQLQDIISKFLPPVLLKLSSVQEGVRKKVRRVLSSSLSERLRWACALYLHLRKM